MTQHRRLLRLTRCAVFAAFLCALSPIVIPVGGPIPFALQIFAVMLCGVTLDLPSALISVGVYLALGLVLPLFSGGNTGLTAIPGPTGGYIWSYLLMLLPIRLLRSVPVRKRSAEYVLAFCGCLQAIALCYACGTLQFCVFTGRAVREALALCVLPFIGFDLIKAAAASLLGVELARAVGKQKA